MFYSINNTHNVMEAVNFGPNSLLWFVAGLIASIILSVTTRLLIDFYYRPRLLIKNPRSVRRSGNTHIRLPIKNRGRSVAENCSVTIKIEQLGDEQLLPTTPSDVSDPDLTPPFEGDVRINLTWRDGEVTRDINRSGLKTIDICRKVKNGIAIASEDGLSEPALILTENSTYSATIRVTSERGKITNSTIIFESTSSNLGVSIS
jgi:hypothetical protein